MFESQNGGDCMEDHSTLRDQHMKMMSDQMFETRMKNFESVCICRKVKTSRGSAQRRNLDRLCALVPVVKVNCSNFVWYSCLKWQPV